MLQDFVSVGARRASCQCNIAEAIYRRMNRRDRRAPIFLDANNRRLFLDTRSEAPEKAGCEIHARGRISNRKGIGAKML